MSVTSATLDQIYEDRHSRIVADRLLAHCVATQQDPPVAVFAPAVALLLAFEQVLRSRYNINLEDSFVVREYLAETALFLAQTTLQARPTPPNRRA